MTGDEALLAVIDWLNDAAVPYILVGSLSSNYHGIPRSTEDADVVINLEGQSLAALATTLPSALHLDPQMSFETVSGTWRNVITLDESTYKIELFRLSDDTHDQERFRRKQRIDMDGRQTYVPCAEDVVITKLRWYSSLRRTKDWDDVRDVLVTKGKQMDWVYVNQWCDLHGTRDLLEKMRQSLLAI